MAPIPFDFFAAIGHNGVMMAPSVTHVASSLTELSSRQRLELAVSLMREISRQTDPQKMVSVFRAQARRLFGGDGFISLSRRGLDSPRYRITRSTLWSEDVNPWEDPDRLPIYDRGILGELLYADEPKIVHAFHPSPDDPAYEHIKEARSLVSLPLYHGGVATNMVIRMSRDPKGWNEATLADSVLQANLFGLATSHLVVARELRGAYAELDHEMKRVADIQWSLLPEALPTIPGLDIAASYKTAARAGGDYYDFFELSGGRWGVLIADVSGHGTPAAVVMAMLRTLLHNACPGHQLPGELLAYANRSLWNRSARYSGTFVTAFYGIYDPSDGSLRYACAGHNPPLLVDRAVRVRELDEAQSVPLAVVEDAGFPEATARLVPGDTLLLYTDGITEAVNDAGEFYGRARLLSCVREDVPNAQHIIDCVVHKLIHFTGGKAQKDDQTLLAMRVREA